MAPRMSQLAMPLSWRSQNSEREMLADLGAQRVPLERETR
jgi:hypothetical protein